MRNWLLHITLFLTAIILLTVSASGQRISFGLYATEGITLTPQGLGELNFNDKQPVILAGNTVNIGLADDAVAIIAIEGRADMDVTVILTPDATLDLNPDNKIPLALRFAYSNRGIETGELAREHAIEVPLGFTSVTFPMVRRSSGLPAPPLVPAHEGYSPPTAKTWLFVYGTLGPVPNNAAAGIYDGNIDVTVSYSTY
jgi:spore coat protein U-like protein